MTTPKAILILASASALLFAGCAGEDELNIDGSWNEDLELPPPSETLPEVPEGAGETVDMDLFDVINLDAPGLEQVKKHYEDGLAWSQDTTTGNKDGYWLAAHALREYYRTRTSVVYPQIAASLINATYTSGEKNIADKALEGHFYVRNFEISEGTTVDYPDFGLKYAEDGSIESINWGMDVPEGFSDSKEWFSQQHRHQWMPAQAKVFRATGDERYIDNWMKVYAHWIKSHPVPENIVASEYPWFGLQPAERLFDQCSMFFYYLDSDKFSPEYLSFFLSWFSKTAQIIMENPYRSEEEGHNINTAQNKALFFAATLFPEFKNAADWKKYSTDNIMTLVETQFFPDGGPKEFDPSYHLGNVAAFYDISLLDSANGAVLPSDFTENLRGACSFIADIMYPDYTIDNYNDTRYKRMTASVITRNLREYKNMFPDDNKFRYLASGRKEGKEPQEYVSIYDKTGYYMLRSGWDKDAMMLVLKNNTGKTWHSQKDNLTFTLFRKGIRFSPDAGCFSYNDDGNRNTYAGADFHNTMVKPNAPDKISRGQNFTGYEGRFKGHYSGRGFEAVVLENDNYNDLTHRRSVFMVDKKFFVIVDEGFGSYEGRVKLLLKGGNPNGKQRDNFVIDNCTKEGDKSEFKKDLPVTMHTNFGANNFMFVTFPETKDGYDSNWTTAYFSDKLGEKTGQRRVYEVNLDKKSDKAARYITVLYPFEAAAEFDTIKISAEFTDNTPETAGTFHEKGPKVKVRTDVGGVKREYNLSYTINQ